MTKNSIVLLMVGVASSAILHAQDSISYTNTFTEQATDWTNTVAFQQFSSSLGTLESITLTASSGLQTTLEVDNLTNSSSHGYYGTYTSISFDTTLYDLMGEGSGPALNLNSPNFHYSLAAFGITNSGPLTASDIETGPTITDSGTLTAFTGNGTVAIDAYTLTGTPGINYGGNTSVSQLTSADLNTIITYDYAPAPAPEPSAFAMIGAGLAGLGMVWRRRNLR